MTRLLDLTILILAVHRITRLITTDVIFEKLRQRVWKKYPPYGNGIGYLITCDWCTSLWVATPVYALYKMNTDAAILVFGAFALSSAAVIIDRVSQR